jgi:spore coat protein CotH
MIGTSFFQKHLVIFLLFSLIAGQLRAQLPTVKIEVATSDISLLEKNPFDGEDVIGSFLGGDGINRATADINYRGAWQLLSLMNSGGFQRNWKVKLEKEEDYRDRREWNYNYEEHPRQELAYMLMQRAGVRVPTCRHVILYVNGKEQGLYSEYEDPDNKKWLTEKFGDNDGDLFKAAFDKPGFARYFATLEDLGDKSENYFYHYDKKTNNNDAAEFDYSSLMAFIKKLNSTSDQDFATMLNANFDTQAFIRYLVVANFISHWDSYPVRPKNFWLYQNPIDSKWNFIPWDIDASFQTSKFSLNQMGTNASIFYQMFQFEPFDVHPEEGKLRPLVHRMMKIPAFKDDYVRAYDSALKTYLKKETLNAVLDSLQTVVANSGVSFGISNYKSAVSNMKSFINTKSNNVANEIAKYEFQSVLVLSSPELTQGTISIFPNPAIDSFSLQLPSHQSLTGNILNLSGQVVLPITSTKMDVSGLKKGIYVVEIIVDGVKYVERLIVIDL